MALDPRFERQAVELDEARNDPGSDDTSLQPMESSYQRVKGSGIPRKLFPSATADFLEDCRRHFSKCFGPSSPNIKDSQPSRVNYGRSSINDDHFSYQPDLHRSTAGNIIDTSSDSDQRRKNNNNNISRRSNSYYQQKKSSSNSQLTFQSEVNSCGLSIGASKSTPSHIPFQSPTSMAVTPTFRPNFVSSEQQNRQTVKRVKSRINEPDQFLGEGKSRTDPAASTANTEVKNSNCVFREKILQRSSSIEHNLDIPYESNRSAKLETSRRLYCPCGEPLIEEEQNLPRYCAFSGNVEVPEDIKLGSFTSINQYLSSRLPSFRRRQTNRQFGSQFPIRTLNIVDPLQPFNNLGRSVSTGNFYRITESFKRSARILEAAIGTYSLSHIYLSTK